MAPDAPQPIRLVPVAKPAGTAESKSKLTFVMPPEPPAAPPPMEPSGEPNGKKLPHRKKIVVHAHPSQPSAVQPFPKPPQKKSGKTWAWILGVLAGIAAVGIAGWWYWNRKDGENTIPAEIVSDAPGHGGKGPEASRKRKSENVRSTLVYQALDLHCKNFGGRVTPDIYSFSASTSEFQYKVEGNPIYFLTSHQVLWTHWESDPGGGHVFARRDFGNTLKAKSWYGDLVAAWTLDAMMKPGAFSIASGKTWAEEAGRVWSNAFQRTICYPAPVVFSFNKQDERFLYLNEAGNPSALQWGVDTNGWFWCHEGRDALTGYAKCLRELRNTLVEYTRIAQDEALHSYHKTVTPRSVPDIHVGYLDAQLREKADVEYEFIVNSRGTNVTYGIKETSTTQHYTMSQFMTLETLDEQLAFFGRFETNDSIDQAFEPLLCYLSQRKLLYEEEAMEAARLDRKFDGTTTVGDGGKIQRVTFSPIGRQTTTARVELSATAESGGKVQFSVVSGPGKIEGNVLTFTGTGKVEVLARQWGNEHWFSATATQSVEVVQAPATQHVELKNTGGISPSEPRQNVRDSGPIPKVTGQEQKGGQLLHEFAPLAKALEAAKRSPTGANYKALMTAWEELPKKQKDAASKPVLWAFSAMLCAKGQANEVLKHQSLIDYPAFRDTVSNPCKTCGGGGRSRVKCETCGGTGTHRVKCNACKGTGICSFCRGTGLPTGSMSGRALQCSNCRGSGKCKSCSRGIAEKPCADCKDGMRSLRCPTCNGSGRIYPADKCERVAQENIEEALRLCKGSE